MGKSEDFTRDRKPAPFGVTRRHILPLVGGDRRLGYYLAPFTGRGAARPVGKALRRKGAVRLCWHLHGSRRSARRNPPEHGRRHLCIKLRPSDGDLTLLQIVPAMNPSYLALDPSLKHLYSV